MSFYNSTKGGWKSKKSNNIFKIRTPNGETLQNKNFFQSR